MSRQLRDATERYLSRVSKEYEKLKAGLSLQVRELIEEQIKDERSRVIQSENIRPNKHREDYKTLRNKMIFCCRQQGYFTYEQIARVFKLGSVTEAQKICEEFRD